MRLDGSCVAAALLLVLTGHAAAYDPAPPLSPWGPNDEAGNTNLLSPAKALQAKDFIKSGINFVLAHDSTNGMPLLPSNVWLQTLRTGWERNWHVTPGGLQATLDYYKGFPGVPGGVPGVGLPLAVWLTDKQVSGVGADNWGVDVQPAQNPPPGIALPVHHQLLTRGIPLFESLVLEALSDHLAAEHAVSQGGARRDAYKFAFFFSPLRIKGGTGSPASPVAFK